MMMGECLEADGLNEQSLPSKHQSCLHQSTLDTRSLQLSSACYCRLYTGQLACATYGLILVPFVVD